MSSTPAKLAKKQKDDANSPSMEEILNSIRDVVEGDEDAAEPEADEELPDEEENSNTEDEDEGILLLDTPAFEEDEEDNIGNAESTPDKPKQDDSPDELLLTSLLETDEPKPKKETAKKRAKKNTKKENEVSSDTKDSATDITSDLLDDLLAAKSEGTNMQEQSDTARLLSQTAAEESSVALKHLMESIPKQKPASPTLRADMTLEELVVESIRPHLALWLNENLPDIVKQLVQKEIRKLIPDED